MTNIYLKVTIETFSRLRFSGFKIFFTKWVFGELQLTQISLNFKTSYCNLKTRPTGQLYVRGIFVEHSHYIFAEYSENVPYEIAGNILWGMFRECWIYECSQGNVSGILNVGIFPKYSISLAELDKKKGGSLE